MSAKLGNLSRTRAAWAGIGSRACAWLIILSLLGGALPIAGAPAAESDPLPPASPSAAGVLAQRVYLPLTVRNLLASPGDALILSWAQMVEGTTRSVLLHWRTPYAAAASIASADALTGPYVVSRRIEGQTTWQQLGTVLPAATPDALLTILGTELTEQLKRDLRTDAQADPLTLQQLFDRLHTDTATSQLLADQFYQVGLAMGMAYLDRTAPLDVVLEYKVVPQSGLDVLTPARVPSGTSGMPTPTGVRAVWTGPATLGIRPSSQPDNATERFEWIGAQAYRPWDGSVYLIWDLPARAIGNAGTRDDGLLALNAAGYRVYRGATSTGPWTPVSPRKADCVSTKYCDILTGAMLPPESEDGFPQFFFREDLREVITDPAQLYKTWYYKVCPVDLLRRDGPCSTPLAVPVRELMPPEPAHDLLVQLDPQLTQLQLTWTYSDTTELSQPLRFYVTRSPSLTLPLDQWTPINPANSTLPYQERTVTGPVTLNLTDTPDKDQVFWYRVQVRDSAGNWSAPGQAAKGAVYTRKDPSFGPVPGYDPADCASNPLPLTLTGLSSEVRQIVVYRGFDPAGPWSMIKRVTVVGSSATITDDYVPPFATDVYYRLEAVDGHGNVSGAQPYCAHLAGSDILPPPPPLTTTVTLQDNVYVWQVELGDTGTPDESQPPTEIDVTMAGEDGPVTVTLSTTSTASGELPPGAWIEIDGSTTGTGGTGASTQTTVRVTNDFLDSNRQMTDLGPLVGATWITDTNGTPTHVRVRIAPVDEPTPPVALFRRISGGSWLQVTEPRRVQPAWIEDHSDPSPYQAYEYMVLLFSPTTYEVMGYWGPVTLGAFYSPQTLEIPGEAIVPVTPYSDKCEITPRSPALLGMRDTIDLANGWSLTGVIYYTSSSGGDCPPPTFSSANAYGHATLTLGRDTFLVRFYHIAVTAAGSHVGGKIVTPALNYSANAPAYFLRHFGQIEFTAGDTWQESRAEVTLTLPTATSIRTAAGDARYVRGVFGGVTSGLLFDPLYFSGAIVDQSLPWVLSSPEVSIDELRIAFGSDVTTQDRLDYGPDAVTLGPGDPENNLAFLRPVYTAASSEAEVLRAGLSGTFSTDAALSYTTSLPAAVELHASGADVVIVGSRIQGGQLRDAEARLVYLEQGIAKDFAVTDNRCGGRAEAGYSLCEWTVFPVTERTLGMASTLPDGAIAIGADGYMSATVMLDKSVAWPSFELLDSEATLYLAAASPYGTTTPYAAAWQQLEHPATGGRLDPGINLNWDQAASVTYSYYPENPLFSGASADLYVRKGGVTGHLILRDTGDTERRNGYGYAEFVQEIDLHFVDNGIVPEPAPVYITDLYLPYPTDHRLQLNVREFDSRNWPLSGDFRLPTVLLHKYWNFTQTPAAWQYSPVGGDYGGVLGDQSRVLALLNSRALVAGLGPQSVQPGAMSVTLALASEWLPDGDVGAVRLYPPPALGYRVSGFIHAFSGMRLSRYHSQPLSALSEPETLGIAMGDNLAPLPDRLLDGSGALTPGSLAACAAGGTLGCGLVVIDGNVAVEYFGEMGAASAGVQAVLVPPIVDQLIGLFPIAINTLDDAVHELMIKPAEMPWIWPVLNEALDIDLPVKFLGNAKGGVLAGVYRGATVFPDQQLFSTDVAAVVTAQWDGSGTEDKLGIFLGYPASQAAFRALAMNRPDWVGGILPYDQWEDVEDDIQSWSAKFGYVEGTGPDDDPVDLARGTWSAWCSTWSGESCTAPKAFDRVYDVVEPVLRSLAGSEAYGQCATGGICSLEPGAALVPSGAAINNGALVATFHRDGLGVQLTSLEGGTQMSYQVYNADLWVTGADVFIRMDWLAVEMNRDGEVIFYGEPYLNLIGDYGVDGEFFGMAFPDSITEWRVEATIDLDTIGIAGIAGLDLAGEFGSGPYNGETVSYLGVRGEGNYMDYRVGGGVLFGSIYDSPVLRRAGYGELLDTLGNENTYTGIYLFVNGDFPVVEGASCLLKANAAGEFRFWYFWDQDVGGGRLSGAVHATVLCVVSGRGQVDLEYARLDEGGQSFGRTCESSSCDLFGGQFWVALGVGWCEPHTWRSWYDRWWGDDWCYSFGAAVDLTYMDPGGLDFTADLDFE